VEETLHLLGHALRQAVGLSARALGVPAAARLEDAGWVLGGHRSRKAALDLDWGQPQAREQARRLVLAEVERGKKWLEQPQRLVADGLPLQDVRDTIAQMVTQDTAPAPDDGPGGRRITKHVAPDRRISIEDADMRHGRKSSAKTFNGFQEHCVLDLESHVTRAVVVRPAHEPEPAAVERLVATLETPPGLLQLAIDLGAMASPRMTPGAEPGVDIMARPWPPGGLSAPRPTCTLDLAHGTVTWPGGQTVPMVLGTDAQFPASACDGGPQRVQCTTARSGQGRRRHIREDEPFQPKLRAQSKTKRGRASLRKRTAVAQALSHHIVPQGRRARSKGVRKHQCDGRRHAAVSNLQVAAHYVEKLQLAS
jgi:hypothetical protein